MLAIKKNIKKLLQIDPQSNVQPLNDLVYLGSPQHGYLVPKQLLTADSICYCIGAGEDISFDVELLLTFGSKIYIFDPSPEAKIHLDLLKKTASEGKFLSIGDKDHRYTYKIKRSEIDALNFIETGVWHEKAIIKFYAPTIAEYASRSISLFHDSTDFIEAPVDRLSNLMHNLNHQTVDLLKLEIEGAEYSVIDTIAQDKPDIKAILVEFDELYFSKGYGHLFRIKAAAEKLFSAGYVLANSTPYFKRLFVRKDVFESLKKTE